VGAAVVINAFASAYNRTSILSSCNPFTVLRRLSGVRNVWCINTVKKLRGLGPRAAIPTERPPLVGKVSANFCG
jgi:hypothetical protein